MSRVKSRSNVPIEISSSPEPAPRPKRPRPRGKPSNVPIIELTDSDDEDNAPPARPRARDSINAVAGASTRPIPHRQLQPRVGSSSSLENLPSLHRKGKASASKILPLFLPSDEENNPPLQPKNMMFEPQPFPIASDIDMGMPDVLHYNPAPTASPEPEPKLEEDPQSTAVAHILEIIPDVETDYLLAMVTKHILDHPDQDLSTVVELILHALFEDSKYPKVDRMGKGKRKQTEAEAEAATNSPPKKSKIDYGDKSRPFNGGTHYTDLALEYLQTSFPFVPKPYLRACLNTHKGHYAPTHLFILDQEKTYQQKREAGDKTNLPYNRRVTPFRPKGKGAALAQDDKLEEERKWLLDRVGGGGPATENTINAADDADDEDFEDGIECGCCFSSCPFDKMVQCPETHLFCAPCMTSYASTLLGTHDPNIKCMDQSGCAALIPASELKRFLPAKLMALWERVKQRKDVEAAGLEGLEECPFCEWGCVIENPDEKLLRCGNMEECGAVSCRSCKKVDHLPKSCKEMDEDKHLDGRHAVEEAMSQALMRNCPKCKKGFIKESGCNKMSCPNCHTLSCYICRQIIKGYDHFNQTPLGQPGGSNNLHAGKCLLWDSVEQRHADEVKAAAEHALEEYKREHPDVEDGDIKVDIPVAPPAPPNPYGANYYQDLLRNAQAALDRANEALQLRKDEEQLQRNQMAEHEEELLVLHNTITHMPYRSAEYAPRIQEVREALARAQGAWYQARIVTQHTQQMVDHAGRQVAVYQPYVNQAPGQRLNVNVNVNFFPAHPVALLPAIPVRGPVQRRPRARAARARR